MQVYFSQIYIEQGAYLPFNCAFQKLLSREVSSRVAPSARFVAEYGEDFDLIIRISAKSSLEENEIRGPTVFRKDKDVEYSIFLPYRKILDQVYPPVVALKYIFLGIYAVLHYLDIDSSRLLRCELEIIKEICSNSAMFEDVEKLTRSNETLSHLNPQAWIGVPDPLCMNEIFGVNTVFVDGHK